MTPRIPRPRRHLGAQPSSWRAPLLARRRGGVCAPRGRAPHHCHKRAAHHRGVTVPPLPQGRDGAVASGAATNRPLLAAAARQTGDATPEGVVARGDTARFRWWNAGSHTGGRPRERRRGRAGDCSRRGAVSGVRRENCARAERVAAVCSAGEGVSVRGHWWRAALGGSWQGGPEGLRRHGGGWSGHPQPPRLVSAAAPVSLFPKAGPSGRGCCPSGNQPVLGLCVTGALRGGGWGARPSPFLQSHFCPAGDGGAAPWWRAPGDGQAWTPPAGHTSLPSAATRQLTLAFAWLAGWVQPAAPPQPWSLWAGAGRRRWPPPGRVLLEGGGHVVCGSRTRVHRGVWRSAAAVCAALCSRHWRRLHRSAAAWTGAVAPRSWPALRAGADTVRVTCVAAGVLGWCGESLRKLCPPSLSTTTRQRRQRPLLEHLQVAPSRRDRLAFLCRCPRWGECRSRPHPPLAVSLLSLVATRALLLLLL